MGLAVDQGDLHVDERISRRHALLGLRVHALLHGRDELARNRTAHHLLGEDDPAAHRKWFDLDVDDRVLAVPAGLFDESAVAFRGAGEGLLQRHPMLDRVDLDTVPGAQPFEDQFGVRLTRAPQRELMGLGILLDAQRGILGGEARQGLGQLVVVGAGVCLDRDGEQGSRGRPPVERDRMVGVVQDVAGLCRRELPDGGDVSRHGLADRALLLAERARQGGNAFAAVAVAVGQRDDRVGSQRAGVDAHQLIRPT